MINDKEEYMNRFSYSYYNHIQHKKDDLIGNILDLSLDRHSIFFNKNVYSMRYLNVLDNYNSEQKEKKIIKFILDNSIKYLIMNSSDKVPNCLTTQKINETYRKISIRNFLIKPKKNKYEVLEIKENKCNNFEK